MNCCWIILLLLFSGRGCCGTMSCSTRDNGCGCGRSEGCRREEREERCERQERRNDRGRQEREDSCACAEARAERLDISSTIPQPWQEYAKRDSEDCQD